MLLTHANPCAKAFQRIKISSNNLHVLIVSKEWSPVMPKYFKLSWEMIVHLISENKIAMIQTPWKDYSLHKHLSLFWKMFLLKLW